MKKDKQNPVIKEIRNALFVFTLPFLLIILLLIGGFETQIIVSLFELILTTYPNGEPVMSLPGIILISYVKVVGEWDALKTIYKSDLIQGFYVLPLKETLPSRKRPHKSLYS